ncbi:hypothetical protein [Halobacterium sp. R2-5]|uniref:hypothetical protein n=1 Tax=Halobacterium sp. R2-5 TaxID=2715751 RepID=UPI00142217B3|nr:hypothetical protein [Halobacterium sp. R2-5]NIC00051.1 hypothetical protein [Halobacterium sp. R2-5]
MTTHHIPKGVSRDTLEDVVAGWEAVGAAAEPKHTADVEDATGLADAVGRQTRFLEDVGVLEADGQEHRLTERGQALAGALAVGDDGRARERARGLLADWPVTETVRGVVRGNPSDEGELVPIVAAVTGHDPEASRVRSGVTTLLDCYDWAGILERDEDGRYRLPDDGERESSAAASPGVASPTATADEEAAAARCGISLGSPPESGGERSETGDPVEVLGETDAADVAELVEELASAEGGAETETDGGGDREAHALTLEVDVDADPEDVEALVQHIREGLTAANAEPGE